MANVEHVDIADGERHEPRGADAALVGQAYVSDGAQSGVWTYPKTVINVTIDDISTAQSVWAVAPHGGVITKIKTVIDGVIITGDAIITAYLGGVLITTSAIVIANVGSLAGTVDSSVPSGANVVLENGAIEIQTDGGSTNVVKAEVYITIQGPQ